MSRLHVNADSFVANDQKARSFTPYKEVEPRAPPQYVGFTFFKADTAAGQKPTWSHAERTQMHLSQTDLLKMVQKRAKKFSATQQYQTLSKLKRTHVDQLINQLRQRDPRGEWTCVYIKEEDKPFKGKNSRRGDYETVSMDVVIMREPVDPSYPKAFNVGPVNPEQPHQVKERIPTNVDGMVAHDEPRQVNVDLEKHAAWAIPGLHQGQMPAMMNNNPHQAPPPRLQQHVPHHQTHHQVHPEQGPHVNQGSFPQGMPAGVHPQPDMQHHAQAMPGRGPGIEVLQHGAEGLPGNMNPHRQGQGLNHGHNPFGQNMKQHLGRESFPHPLHVNHGSNIPRAPTVPEPEPEWAPESSSIGDDESVLFDHDEVSSITDGSEAEEGEEYDDADREKSQPWRGSLFRRHSSKARRNEPAYRSHYRKHSKTGHEAKHGRVRYPAGYIDVVPAESKNSTHRQANIHSRELSRPARERPKIIHTTSDNLDLVTLDEKYRGLRARNDIRSRILDDREARVERREKMVDYRTQMLRERLDEVRLNRSLSLHESGPFYPRRYYLHDAL
ncbi:hypothetical protein EYZ11_008300 [Aspergillus tanneri]|nr:hypothetical protein EYZ11_008300 [Aspergillus tanneri]